MLSFSGIVSTYGVKMLSYLAYHMDDGEENKREDRNNRKVQIITEPAEQKVHIQNLNSEYRRSEQQLRNNLDRAHSKMDEHTVLDIDAVDGGTANDPKVQFNNGANNADRVDGPKMKSSSYASKKNVAEGMMDIALLTANANQLRFLFTYNTNSKTFYVSVGLIIVSLVLQVAVGIALIFKRQMKIRGRKDRADRTNDFLVGGVFLVTVINVFVASFTMTEAPKPSA